MKNPTTLFTCVTRHDACFLKNIIQRITFLAVDMVRVKGGFQLYVDKCNYDKAKIILITQLEYLPSVIAKKSIQKENTTTRQVVNNNHPTQFARLLMKLDSLLVNSIRFN